MGIKLDWEVEAEGGWQEIGEDPAAIAARQRRRRRLRNVLIGLLALILLAAGGTALQLGQARRARRAELEQTIATETLALRIGDRGAFLDVQADVGEWRRLQADAFETYQSLGVVPTGEIVEIEVDGEQARVVLRERLDEMPYLVTWFYTREDGGWQHAIPPAGAWGATTEAASTHFDATFPEADRPFVEALLAQLDGWWGAACTLTGCVDYPPRPRVRVMADPLTEVGWAAYDEWTLAIPSPSMGRVPEGEPGPDPALARTLARLVADRWAAVATPDAGESPRPTSDLAWVEAELAAWLGHAIAPDLPTSDFFDPLVDAYSPDVIPALLGSLAGDERLVPALEGATGAQAADLPISWEGYLAHRLRAEAELIDQGYTTEATLLFADPETPRDAEIVIDVPTERRADPATIRVTGTQAVGGLTLAEVRFREADPAPDTGEMATYEPFRLTADGWVHTSLALSDWGSEARQRTRSVTIVHHDLDNEAVMGLAQELQDIYRQVQADFGLPEDRDRQFYVVVAPYSLETFYSRETLTYYPDDAIFLHVLSPYAAARSAGVSPAEHVRAAAAWRLVEALARERAAPVSEQTTLPVAFVGWEIERLGIEQTALPDDARMALVNSEAARVLVELLVYTYGEEAIPPLLDGLSMADDVDGWLAGSLGVEDSTAIRSLWEACLAYQDACPLD